MLSQYCEWESPLNGIELPEEWKRLASKIQERKGTVMVIGAPDTGKTTLTQFLVRELCKRGEAVAYIDGDIGQSTLGPPTTQGLALFDSPYTRLEEGTDRSHYFVGSVSPRGHGLETVVGLRRLLDRSQAVRDRIAILDTTGYVVGEDALELKYQKMDLLDPCHIVAVQRHGEIEPILRARECREKTVVYRLPASTLVQTRSQEERRRYRWSRFKDYFKTLLLYRVDLRRTSLTGTHKIRIHDMREADMEGLLLGLNGPDNFLVALGLLEMVNPTRGTLSCLVPPTPDLERARTIRLGSIRIDLSEETNGERFLRYG